MICQGKTVAEIAAVGNEWSTRIKYMNPRHFVELGTGQGASGARIMEALGPDSRFTTINYADGHTFGEQLRPYYSDHRLTMLALDTINRDTLKVVPYGIDLLFMDTTHEAWHVAEELYLWQNKLENGAMVIVDDLNQHDMMEFWDSLPYEKALSPGSSQGLFRYDRFNPYDGNFDRPYRSTYWNGRR